MSHMYWEQLQQSFILSTNPTGNDGTLTPKRGDNGKPTAELWDSLFKTTEQFHDEASADYHRSERKTLLLVGVKGEKMALSQEAQTHPAEIQP